MTGSSIKIYAEAIWNHWLSARFGDDVVRKTWEVSPSQKSFAVDAYNKAIKSFGGPGFARAARRLLRRHCGVALDPGLPGLHGLPRREALRDGSPPRRRARSSTTRRIRLYNVKPTGAPSVTLEVEAKKGTQSSISLVGREGGDGGAVTTETKYLGKGGNGDGHARRSRQVLADHRRRRQRRRAQQQAHPAGQADLQLRRLLVQAQPRLSRRDEPRSGLRRARPRPGCRSGRRSRTACRSSISSASRFELTPGLSAATDIRAPAAS